MRLSTFGFCLKRGLVNIFRNIWSSLVSTAIVAACIFLFCVFFSIISNIHYMVLLAESTMGITVFFEEGIKEAEILSIGDKIKAERGEVSEVVYTSAAKAWETFQKEYFGDNLKLAEGFADDNPLADSASLEIFLDNIENQGIVAAYLEALPGVRKVNYSHSAASGLASLNKMMVLLFGMIMALLLAVAVFLISNTITVAAAFRKNENKIMRLIGATNFMIRAPFVVEGTILGLLGAAVPLGAMFFLYQRAVAFVTERFQFLVGIIRFLPIEEIYPTMAAVSLGLGGGLGFIVSFMTIRRHLRV